MLCSPNRSPLSAGKAAVRQSVCLLLLLLVAGGAQRGRAEALSLEQVLAIGMPASADLEESRRRIARDQALLNLAAAARLPQLALISSASFTQVGTSVGLLTNLPTLGDISLGLQQNGYTTLQNTFGNVGLVLDVNLLPLRQGAELAASRLVLESSRAGSRERERQTRFELVSAYRQLQLRQSLVPVWQQALKASTALERDAEAIERRGLAARIDVLRARMLRAQDGQGLAQSQADLETSRLQLATLLALPVEQAPVAADPIKESGPWPLPLQQTLEQALRDRPLLAALQAQQLAQGQQARASKLALLPSLSLVVGGGYSGDRLATPVLNQGGSFNTSLGSLPLPELRQSAVASGSFYNWGAALLLRQPLYDGGRANASAALAERQRSLLEADEELARRRIRMDVSAAWSSLTATGASVAAARQAVQAGEQALHDAQLRYRALVEPVTEVLLVQRDLQLSQAALLTALTRQALDWAVLQRETGAADPIPPQS
ncbi:MAG: TolC family protein [Cyanobium sp.]